MKKLDNKGFAITGILYTVFIMFLLILVSVLSGLRAKKNLLERSQIALENSYQGKTNSNWVETAKSTKKAPVSGKYIFNLNTVTIDGYNNVSNVRTQTIKYSINNREISVKAEATNGHGFTSINVQLEKDTLYNFSCITNGTWGNSGDTVEAYFVLNKDETGTGTVYRMESNNYTFVPTTTGTYWLRLNVNKDGRTYTFKDINIGTSCSSYLKRNDSITTTGDEKMTLVPKICNDYIYNLSFDEPDSQNIMTLNEIYSFEEE